MPWSAVGAGLGALGMGGSMAGGKKAQNQANKLASTQLGLEQGMFNKAGSLMAPAGDFWSNLLKGGQAAVQATGPIASQIGQAAQGARNSIMATIPRGGEQNLALANTFNDASNNVARLYAGMQPAAAGALGQLGGAYLGAGQSLGFPATMGGLGSAQMGQQGAMAGGAGFGSLLYNAMNKMRNGGGGGSFSPFAGGIS